jgi:transposase
LAQHFASLLLQKHSLVQPIEEPPQDINDFQCVDINSIRHTSVRSIGCEHVALSAYNQLDFNGLFTRLNFSTKQISFAAAAIIGRAIYPVSERALHNQLQFRSGLDELLGTSFAKLSLDQLYFISDDLYRSKKVIEKHLREQEKTLFNLQETIILYDISNTYFEGACKAHPKAKRGKSKEMRTDCPLLAIGVVLDSDGFPKHSEIFDGNVNERATLQEMITRLNRQDLTQRPIIVLDSGIATKDNIDWLKSQGYAYIVMMKQKERPSMEACREVVIRDEGNQYVSATLKYDKRTDDHILWCYSEQRFKKEQDIKQHKTNVLEKSLLHLKEGLALPGRLKTLEKVHQKIGRLRDKYARLAQHYKITVHPADDGIAVHDITWTYDEAEITRSFSGTYTLRTNVKELTAEKIWEIYVMLSEAESCFRCLKSEAGLRPNWHSREDRIDGHIFISLLAYHLIVTIRKRLKDQGISESWEIIRERLSSHVLIATSLKTKEEGAIYLKQASEPDEYQKSIYRALGLAHKPVKAQKTVIQSKDVVSKS